MNDQAPITKLGQQWTSRRVIVFHGQRDTHIATGDDYDTRTLGEIFAMPPSETDKGEALACIPSTYHDYDARNHATQRDNGIYVMLCADIDSGDHPLERIETLARELVGEHAFLIYSSAHARTGDMRWRVLIPIDQPCRFEAWHDAQNALFAYLEYSGIEVDRAMDRAAQPVFLPNVPEKHTKTGDWLRDEWTGNPLYYQRATSGTQSPALPLTTGTIAQGIDAIKRKREDDERERARIRREIEAKRAARPQNEGASVMADFNAGTSIANLLELYGYQQSPRNTDDWRSPKQTGDSYATRVIGDKWVSLSMSDAAAQLGDTCATGCYGDAYDLFVHYEHGGDHKAAFRALYAERRAAQPQAWSAPPPPDPDDPGPSEDILDGPADPIEVAELSAQDVAGETEQVAPLRFEWAGQVQPILDGFWLIDDWLPTSGIAAIYGHPGSGKSFLAFHMAAHIASGREWAGKHVERGLVVYVVAEGQTGARNRLYAMRENGDIEPDAPFIIVPCPIDLQAQEGDTKALIATIEIASDLADVKPAMVVLDTLSKTFGAGKENTDDMVAYVNNCQKVASAFDCLTVIVHHRPKDQDSKDLRGHSSLRGNIDTAILVEKGEIKTATTLKQKDGEDNLQVRFRLNKVIIGHDRRGKEISTCIVGITDDMPQASSDTTFGGLNAKEREALQVLADIIENQLSDDENAGTNGLSAFVPLADWKEALGTLGTIDRDKPETCRKQFQRLYKSLGKKEKIQIDGTFVCLPGQCGT